MRINKISPQPSCKAVNQKYFEWAKKDYSLEKNVSCDWMQRISYDVFLFKKLLPQDGIDTVNAVIKYMNKTDEGIDDLLNSFRKASRGIY